MPICAHISLPGAAMEVQCGRTQALSPLPKTPTPSQSTCVPPHCTSRHLPCYKFWFQNRSSRMKKKQEFFLLFFKFKTQGVRKEPNMHRINIVDTRMGADVNQPHRHYESSTPSNENSTQSLWSSTILLQTITVWHERWQHTSPRRSSLPTSYIIDEFTHSTVQKHIVHCSII